MDRESTHRCGGGITSVDMRDQVYVDLDHYEDRAAGLAGSTDAMSALPQCLHESIATSSLFDADRYARYLKRAYHLLWQAHVAANGQQEITMPALGAEVRQA